jgi:hypothetical protein
MSIRGFLKRFFSFDGEFTPRFCHRCGLDYDATFKPADGPMPRDSMCSSCVKAVESPDFDETKYDEEKVHELLAEAAGLAIKLGWSFDKFQDEGFAHFATIAGLRAPPEESEPELLMPAEVDDMLAAASPEMVSTLNDEEVVQYLSDPGIVSVHKLDHGWLSGNHGWLSGNEEGGAAPPSAEVPAPLVDASLGSAPTLRPPPPPPSLPPLPPSLKTEHAPVPPREPTLPFPVETPKP